MEDRDKYLKVHGFLTSEPSLEEKKILEQWLSEDDQNQVIYDQLKQIWSVPTPTPKVSFNKDAAFAKHLALIAEEEKPSNLSSEIESIKENRPALTIVKEMGGTSSPSEKRVSPIRWLQAVAAVFVLGVGAWFGFSQGETIQSTILASEKAEMTSLADGSLVHLNQGSKLDIVESSKVRKVNLKGEAFFEVKKDKSMPFIVETEEAIIKVLGTSFTVNSVEHFVSVKEGKVNVNVDGQDVVLTDNQKIGFTGGKLHEVQNVDFEESSLWFSEELRFSNAPFDKVIDDLSKHFKISFILPQQKNWSECTFTSGSLKNTSLDDVLIMLQLTYQLEFTKVTDSSYKLTKVKCK